MLDMMINIIEHKKSTRRDIKYNIVFYFLKQEIDANNEISFEKI